MKLTILASVSAFALFSATSALAAGLNDSTVSQTGSGAIASVTQTGGENDSRVNQSGTGGKATIRQVEVDSGNDHPRIRGYAGVEGSGDAVRTNFSTVMQTGNSVVDSYQSGDLNRSQIGQTGAGSSATLDQRGIFNNSDINQSNASDAKVYQRGLYGDNNSVVTQSGGGRVVVDQSGNYTFPTAFPSNDSRAYQESNSDASITQIGQQNNSTVNQYAGSNNATATVYQDNTAAANESGLGPRTNNATTLQFSDATAYTQQIGQGNTANTYQYAGAIGSDSKIYQQSDDNGATVSQFSPGNTSVVYQAGTGSNMATVSQN